MEERFHDFSCNYPPLILYLFYPLFYLLKSHGLWPDWPSHLINLYFRIPLLVVQFATYLFVSRKLESQQSVKYNKSWFLILALALNPALLGVGPLWGQLDVFLWLTVVISLHFLRKRIWWISILFAGISALMKPQFLLFIPLYIVFLRNYNFRKILFYSLSVVIVYIVGTLPFILQYPYSLIAGYQRTFNGSVGLVSHAQNFWWIYLKLTDVLSIPTINLQILGSLGKLTVLILLVFILSDNKHYNSRCATSYYPLATFIFLTYYMFLPGMSSRFLVYGLCFLILWAWQEYEMKKYVFLVSIIQMIALMTAPLEGVSGRYGAIFGKLGTPILWIAALGLIFVYIQIGRKLWHKFNYSKSQE